MSKATTEDRSDIATQEAADLGPIIGIKEKTKRDEEIQKGLQETDSVLFIHLLLIGKTFGFVISLLSVG